MRESIKEIDILWITAGDAIAMTAATQPSIEDVVMGGIPGIPKTYGKLCWNARANQRDSCELSCFGA